MFRNIHVEEIYCDVRFAVFVYVGFLYSSPGVFSIVFVFVRLRRCGKQVVHHNIDFCTQGGIIAFDMMKNKIIKLDE